MSERKKQGKRKRAGGRGRNEEEEGAEGEELKISPKFIKRKDH
jgi:hypothetical protein